jgi:hypothetical protein
MTHHFEKAAAVIKLSYALSSVSVAVLHVVAFVVTVPPSVRSPPFELLHTPSVPPPPHTAGEVHVPHDDRVRVVPQLSAAVTPPQFLPTREQNAASVSGVHVETPQTLAVPPPAHVLGAVQVPHEVTERELPQLSFAVTVPQFLASRVQNAASVSAVHGGTPQTLAVTAPQVWPGVVQVPHEVTVRLVPQLSAAVTFPQFLPSRAQNAVSVSAVQPQTLVVTPPQVCGAVQVPHDDTVRELLQLSLAVMLPQFLPSREQNAASVSAVQPLSQTP